jgi:VTC domain
MPPATASADIMSALEHFDSVTLDELDERASLLRRVDNKYAVPHDVFLELLRRLSRDHDVLEMDGKREFAYETVYFETPSLRCFRDHVEGDFPRFKARTRLYRDSGSCVFEVKLKDADGETDKHQVEHPADRADELTDEARQCLESALSGAGIELDETLEPRLKTSFCRITLATRDEPERLTCDVGVRLTGSRSAVATLADDLVLVETKSESGESPADRALQELGIEQISLSKYRVGMSLVGGAPGEEREPGAEYFGG